MLWAETYRPTKIDECILPSEVDTLLKSYITSGDIPNLIFKGKPGCGKTTAARVLVEEIGGDYIFINASNERNIDTLREKIINFITTVSITDPGKMKTVILDEADYLNAQSTQPALRSTMELYAKNARFILTANYTNKIIAPLRSRCTVVDFSPHNDKEESKKLYAKMLTRINKILDENKMPYKPEILLELAEYFKQDWRSLLNELQRQYNLGFPELSNDYDAFTTVDMLIDSIVKQDFMTARKYLAHNSHLETEHVVRECLVHLEKAPRLDKKKCMQDIYIIASDYLDKDTRVADKEINRAAFVAELMKACVWK